MMKKYFFTIITIAFLAAACANKNTATPAPSGGKLGTASPAPVAPSTPSSTPAANSASWLKFTYPPFGMEIAYPNTWKAYVADGQIKLSSPENQSLQNKIRTQHLENVAFAYDINIAYWNNYKDEAQDQERASVAASIPDLIKKREDFYKSGGQIALAGGKAYTYVAGGFHSYYTILTEHNGHIYQIRFGNKGSDAELSLTEKTILSTFKFTR